MHGNKSCKRSVLETTIINAYEKKRLRGQAAHICGSNTKILQRNLISGHGVHVHTPISLSRLFEPAA